eukprot:665312-Amphidinium_carterae.1
MAQQKAKESRSNFSCQPAVHIPVEVMPRLLLGNAMLAKSFSTLQEHTVTHIVNVTELANSFPEDFSYLHVPVADEKTADIASWLCPATAFMQDALQDPAAN